MLSKSSKAVSKGTNSLVNNAKNLINKLFSDDGNSYYMNGSNYTEKMNKVKESKEWKEIVKKNDPEYVKKNADGSTTYLIDDYVVKKKHPILDIADDIADGREVDINDITMESTVASLKDYGKATISIGMLGLGLITKGLTEKFKFQQGTYDDDIKKLTQTANVGAEYVRAAVDGTSVSPDTVAKTAKTIKASAEATEVVRSINDGNVVRAAQVIMEADAVQTAVGSNDYYKVAEATLSNLSEEEIAAVNLLIRQMRNG
jgi:hypothetical protein